MKPHRSIEENYEFHSRLDKKKRGKKGAEKKNHPLTRFLTDLTPMQRMVIALEILNQPKGLRDDEP